MHILVVGWFSFEHMGNSAGDMIARDMVCDWLNEAKVTYRIAVANPFSFEAGVNWENENPSIYTDILFVCGPFGNGWPLTELLARFNKCRLIGVNLTLLHSLEEWNPFSLLYERDSSRASNPDISFYAPPPKVPVVGIILITKQDEYGQKDMHVKVNNAIEAFTQSREMSIVYIDTALENNKTRNRSAGEVEALIAKMDVVITSRLHGTVLALKNGVPVISVDPVEGGAKVSKQVNTFGWPILFNSNTVSNEALSEAFNYCLTAEAKVKARECTQKAIDLIGKIREKFILDITQLSKKGTPNG